jgi:hypothetical protein
MWIPSWLRFKRPASSRASSRGPRRHRPSLEQLEGRSLLTAYTAASVADLIADINAANTNPANLAGEANTITLEAGMTFKLTAVDNTIAESLGYATNGLPVIAANDNLTIDGKGATIERSSVTGTPAFRLFDVAAGASLTLTDLTLQGGRSEGEGAQGGAISNLGSLALKGVTVQNNVAQGSWRGTTGGGIYSSGTLTLEDTTIRNNLALGLDGSDSLYGGGWGGNAFGGGVYIGGGTAQLTSVTLSGNSAQGGNGGDGGVYYERCYDRDYRCHGSYVASDGGGGGSAIGGGLFAQGATVTLLNSSVTGNTAKRGTGGHGGAGRGLKGLDGPDGVGVAGGLYLNTLTYLDAFTAAHVTSNHASTSDPDIAGNYLPAN